MELASIESTVYLPFLVRLAFVDFVVEESNVYEIEVAVDEPIITLLIFTPSAAFIVIEPPAVELDP